MTVQKKKFSCATCGIAVADRVCYGQGKQAGKGCPTLTRTEVIEESVRCYEEPRMHEFARQSSIQEAECYANRHQRPYVMQPTKTRIMEICEFAHRMQYKKLGLAFCMGLVREAEVVQGILEVQGFEVVSAVCKVGKIPKETIGITDDQKVHRGTTESMCNPIAQAKLLNAEHTDFNVVLGLCVGHDSMFFKYSEALTTVLAVKDRVLGHNPLAAIYLADSYYRKVKTPLNED